MKLPKHLLLIVLLFASCGNTRDDQVVVVEKTKSYHRANCGKLHMAHSTTISVADAIAQHLRPCPYCKPDKGV